eukprot:766696-Hanusia_phi.AAC.9
MPPSRPTAAIMERYGTIPSRTSPCSWLIEASSSRETCSSPITCTIATACCRPNDPLPLSAVRRCFEAMREPKRRALLSCLRSGWTLSRCFFSWFICLRSAWPPSSSYSISTSDSTNILERSSKYMQGRR